MTQSTYHGPKPVTSSDVKMARSHLQSTMKLNMGKIADHEAAIKDAQANGIKPSVNYNRSHSQSHKKDNQKIKKSLNTLKGIKPQLNNLYNQLGNK